VRFCVNNDITQRADIIMSSSSDDQLPRLFTRLERELALGGMLKTAATDGEIKSRVQLLQRCLQDLNDSKSLLHSDVIERFLHYMSLASFKPEDAKDAKVAKVSFLGPETTAALCTSILQMATKSKELAKAIGLKHTKLGAKYLKDLRSDPSWRPEWVSETRYKYQNDQASTLPRMLEKQNRARDLLKKGVSDHLWIDEDAPDLLLQSLKEQLKEGSDYVFAVLNPDIRLSEKAPDIGHWQLAIFEVERNAIWLYDSMGNVGSGVSYTWRAAFQLLWDFVLCDEFARMRGGKPPATTKNPKKLSFYEAMQYLPKDAKGMYIPPHQYNTGNGWDCGVFVCYNAWQLFRGISLFSTSGPWFANSSDNNVAFMPRMRKAMAIMYNMELEIYTDVEAEDRGKRKKREKKHESDEPKLREERDKALQLVEQMAEAQAKMQEENARMHASLQECLQRHEAEEAKKLQRPTLHLVNGSPDVVGARDFQRFANRFQHDFCHVNVVAGMDGYRQGSPVVYAYFANMPVPPGGAQVFDTNAFYGVLGAAGDINNVVLLVLQNKALSDEEDIVRGDFDAVLRPVNFPYHNLVIMPFLRSLGDIDFQADLDSGDMMHLTEPAMLRANIERILLHKGSWDAFFGPWEQMRAARNPGDAHPQPKRPIVTTHYPSVHDLHDQQYEPQPQQLLPMSTEEYWERHGELDQRYALGEISEEEFNRAIAALTDWYHASRGNGEYSQDELAKLYSQFNPDNTIAGQREALANARRQQTPPAVSPSSGPFTDSQSTQASTASEREFEQRLDVEIPDEIPEPPEPPKIPLLATQQQEPGGSQDVPPASPPHAPPAAPPPNLAPNKSKPAATTGSVMDDLKSDNPLARLRKTKTTETPANPAAQPSAQGAPGAPPPPPGPPPTPPILPVPEVPAIDKLKTNAGRGAATKPVDAAPAKSGDLLSMIKNFGKDRLKNAKARILPPAKNAKEKQENQKLPDVAKIIMGKFAHAHDDGSDDEGDNNGEWD
jgi:hypothetical protein